MIELSANLRRSHSPSIRDSGDRSDTAPCQALGLTWRLPPFVNALAGGAVTPRRGCGQAGRCFAGRPWWS